MRTAALAVIGAALAVPLVAGAAPGDLDPGFGNRGTTLTQVDDTGSGAAQIAVLPNGRLVVAGVGLDGLGEDTDADFAVVGYTADGKLDKRFGEGGSNVFDFGLDYVWELPGDLAITADGKVLVGGSTEMGDDYDDAAGIARLKPNGDFDGSLDGDGTLGVSPEGLRDVTGLLPLSDGDFLVAGPAGQSVAVARFNSDGSLDASFAGDGVATEELGAKAQVGHAVLDADGGVVVEIGSAEIGSGRFALIRFGPDGTLDGAFGDGGRAEAEGEDVTELALAPAGKLVAAGAKTVVRFDGSGTIDSSFAEDGTFTFSGPRRFSASGLAVGPTGTIALAGTGGRKGTHFAVAQLRKSGKLDRRFGDEGYAIEDLGGQEAALGVAIQDDRVVAAGRARGRSLFIGRIAGRDTRVAVARFLAR